MARLTPEEIARRSAHFDTLRAAGKVRGSTDKKSLVGYMENRRAELHRQFDYYVAHQSELVERYKDRWIVLAHEKVVGDFGAESDAYEFAQGNCEAGTFMIQLVEPGEQNYTQTFHSRLRATE